MLIAYASLRGQIGGGLVRPLAVAAGRRIDGLPDVPTFAEAGYAALQREIPRSWWGLVAPRGTPEAAVARLAAEFRRVAGIFLCAKAHRGAGPVGRRVPFPRCHRAIMTNTEDIPALMDRIARAETERDEWQSRDRQQEYLWARDAVAALELELDERLR